MKRGATILLWGGAAAGLLAAAGGLCTRAAAGLLAMAPPRLRPPLLGGEPLPAHARLLGVYLGLALSLACALVLWRRRPGAVFPAGGRGRFLFAVLLALALLALWLSVNRVLWDDEIEHVHASWYVQQGQAPYRDFFEHHHPLLWLLLAPLVSLLGEGLAVLAAARLLMLATAGGIAWLTWRITRLAGGDAGAGLLAVALLFSGVMFVPCVIEVRPDVPMVFLALAAVERLLVYLEQGRLRALLAAAFLAALSFLFLQKAVFLVAAAAIWLALRAFSGKTPPAHLAAAAAVFLLPLLAFCAWLAARGALGDYLLCNWLLNAQRRALPALWLDVGRLALVNAAFWLSLPPALFRALRPRAAPPALRLVAGLGVAALAALALLPNPADRHFLLALPLLSVVVAAWAGDAAALRLRGRWRAAFLAALLAAPLPFLAAHGFPLNGAQLEKIGYVLRHSAAGEKVFDGRNGFNLFRPDLHYFWFQTGPGELLEAYRRLRRGPRSEYDPCSLIRAQKPRFIALDDREWAECALWREYALTPYPGLFSRASLPTPGQPE